MGQNFDILPSEVGGWVNSPVSSCVTIRKSSTPIYQQTMFETNYNVPNFQLRLKNSMKLEARIWRVVSPSKKSSKKTKTNFLGAQLQGEGGKYKNRLSELTHIHTLLRR